ncbi:MAG TPA: glycosyltransferase family 2 protein [Ferruginibacter sp.]|jgi:glycosyltransferase involved in cell wall biosynthesis|nr:glycosyltransferase family 2 protein [Ferruginibacter sp.]
MKVTIITVTYNSAQFVEDCINSVIAQDYEDIEYIVVDGGSTDETVSIIKRYENKIATWVSEKDKGMYDAINKGMKMATGDIIGLLNSDDLLASTNVISSIVASFKAQRVDCIYADLVYVDRYNTQKLVRYWKGLSYKRRRFNYGWMPAHPTFYVRKEIVDQLGEYESHFFTAADYEFMSRLLYLYRISAYYLPMLTVKMRTGGASNVSFYSRFRANRRDYLSMKKNKMPFPFIVSLLKPLSKLNQYYYTFFKKIV